MSMCQIRYRDISICLKNYVTIVLKAFSHKMLLLHCFFLIVFFRFTKL